MDPAWVSIHQNLFEDIDPTAWSLLMLLLYLPYAPERRMRGLIEHPWNFVFIRPIAGGTMDATEEPDWEAIERRSEEGRRQDVRTTFEIFWRLGLLQRHIRGRAEIEAWLREVEETGFLQEEESLQAGKARRLRRFLGELLDFWQESGGQ